MENTLQLQFRNESYANAASYLFSSPVLAIILGLSLCFVSTAGRTAGAETSSQNYRVSSGSTSFLAVGRPSLLKIRGEGSGPVGNLQIKDQVLSGNLEMDLASFTTHLDTRDHHLKEKYLQVAQFPKAILAIKSVNVPDLKKLPGDLHFSGELTLHGVTNPVTGEAHLKQGSPGAVDFNAQFPIKITDFKIDIPSYAGIKVADLVDVTVQSEAVLDSSNDKIGKGKSATESK